MKIFLKKISFYLTFIFLLLEIVFRIFLDDAYFQKVDPYIGAVDSSFDYIFIGSSRFEVAVNEKLLSHLMGAKVLNTARGFYSAGVSYQALEKALELNPNLINGGKVILEYPQFQDVYLSNFENERYRVWEKGFPMVQFLIPHLERNELSDFLKYSPNSTKAKAYLLSAYHLSVVRNIPVIQEFILDNFIKIKSWNMTQQIVNQKKMSLEPKIIIDHTDSTYYQSLIYHYKQLVWAHGGELLLLDVPKFSEFIPNFRGDYVDGQSKSARLNVLMVEPFLYDDSDFDDKLHLNSDRIEEFTTKLSRTLLEIDG